MANILAFRRYRRAIILLFLIVILSVLTGFVIGIYVSVTTPEPIRIISQFLYTDISSQQLVINSVWLNTTNDGVYVVVNISNIGDSVVDAVVIMKDDLIGEVNGIVLRSLKPGESKLANIGFLPFKNIEIPIEALNNSAVTVKPRSISIYTYPAGVVGYLATYFMLISGTSTISVVDVVKDLSLTTVPSPYTMKCGFIDVVIRLNNPYDRDIDVFITLIMSDYRGPLAQEIFEITIEGMGSKIIADRMRLDVENGCRSPISVMILTFIR